MAPHKLSFVKLSYTKLSLLVMICFVGLSINVFAQSNLDSGLVAYYPFNGDAMDLSDNSNHGTVNGPTLATDRFAAPNSSYHYGGLTDKISVPHNTSLNPGNQQSLSAWVYIDQTMWAQMMVISKGIDNDTGCYKLWLFRQPDLTYKAWYTIRENIVPNATAQATVNFTLNSWNHICGTFDGTLIKMYINGRLDSTVTTAASMVTNTKDLWIGHMQTNYFFAGKIDEARVYNRALTECEVLTLYKFGEPANTVITDNNICEKDSSFIEITTSDSLKTFQLQDTLSGSLLGVPVNGTSNTIILPTGQLSSTTAFRIIETDTATGCQRSLDSIQTIIVTSYPSTPSISVVGPPDSLKCSITGTSYQWFYEGTLLPETTQMILPSQVGNYQVIVIENGCSSDTSAIFNYVGIDPSSFLSQFKVNIYPNPTDGILYIELNKNYSYLSISLKNLVGEEILSSYFSNVDHIDLELSHLKAGLYFIQISIDNQTAVFKIINK